MGKFTFRLYQIALPLRVDSSPAPMNGSPKVGFPDRGLTGRRRVLLLEQTATRGRSDSTGSPRGDGRVSWLIGWPRKKLIKTITANNNKQFAMVA